MRSWVHPVQSAEPRRPAVAYRGRRAAGRCAATALRSEEHQSAVHQAMAWLRLQPVVRRALGRCAAKVRQGLPAAARRVRAWPAVPVSELRPAAVARACRQEAERRAFPSAWQVGAAPVAWSELERAACGRAEWPPKAAYASAQPPAACGWEARLQAEVYASARSREAAYVSAQPRGAPWAQRAAAGQPAGAQPSGQPEEAAGEPLLAEPAVGAAAPWGQQRAAAESEPVSTAGPRRAVAQERQASAAAPRRAPVQAWGGHLAVVPSAGAACPFLPAIAAAPARR